MGNCKAVFLDRDGTINFDPGYLGDPNKVRLLPGVDTGIKFLRNDLNFKIIVVSNQSGITRGLISEADVKSVNSRINELLAEKNTRIDAFYFCPYHPEFDPPEKVKCRKPSPEMIFTAAEDFEIDLTQSYLVGDALSDIEAGNKAGVKTILLNNERKYDKINILHLGKKTPNFVATNFSDACTFIKNDLLGNIN